MPVRSRKSKRTRKSPRKRTRKYNMRLNDLPIEMQLQIAGNLSPKDKVALRGVNKSMRSLFSDSDITEMLSHGTKKEKIIAARILSYFGDGEKDEKRLQKIKTEAKDSGDSKFYRSILDANMSGRMYKKIVAKLNSERNQKTVREMLEEMD